MTRLIVILLFIGSIIMVSCSKDEINPAPVSSLNGSWKYIGYSGGLAGVALTQQDTVTYFLQFDTDRYTSIRNNTQGCGPYTFQKDSSSNQPYIGLLTLSGESAPNQFDTYLHNDTLTLYPHATMDAFSYHFIYSLKQFDWCDSTFTH